MKKILYLSSAVVLSLLLFAFKSPQYSAPIKIKNNSVNIAYIDTHKGDTTLLFVHGWCINKGYWSNQLAYFSKRYRVVTIDLPGFGQSGKNRSQWDARTFGGDVSAVITQLHLKNVVLIGHSMAGDIILEAAIKNPKQVIALVGVDNFKSVGIGHPPSAKANADYDKAIDSLRDHFTFIATDYITHQLFSKTTPDSIKQRVLHDALTSDTIIAAACMKRDTLKEQVELKKTAKPLYLINSDVSPTAITGFQKLQIPFKVYSVHGSGHYPMIEQPAVFNKQLQLALTAMHQ
jgi:pimeloyl-ACP methyl ester carboxylesterase